MLTIGESFPKFSLPAYNPLSRGEKGLPEQSTIDSNTIKDQWIVLWFYPADFSYVCPTELEDLQKVYEQLKLAGAELYAISTDSINSHKVWLEKDDRLRAIQFSLLSDHSGSLSKELGILNSKGTASRATFILDPEGVVRSIQVVDDNIGRSAHETIRELIALIRTTIDPEVLCPASWELGQPVIQQNIV